jgi:hypothetical protein
VFLAKSVSKYVKDDLHESSQFAIVPGVAPILNSCSKAQNHTAVPAQAQTVALVAADKMLITPTSARPYQTTRNQKRKGQRFTRRAVGRRIELGAATCELPILSTGGEAFQRLTVSQLEAGAPRLCILCGAFTGRHVCVGDATARRSGIDGRAADAADMGICGSARHPMNSRGRTKSCPRATGRM